MDIARNLLYQKNNFGNIYKGYFNYGLQEVAVDVLRDDIGVEASKYITIVAEDYQPILRDLFYIEELLDYLEEYEEVFIEKDLLDSYEVREGGDTLFIKCIHPYMLKNNNIRIIKKLKKKNSVDNSLIIVFRELNNIEKRIVKDKLHKVKVVNSILEIKDILIDFHSYYNEKKFIEDKLVCRNKKVLGTNITEDSFKIAIAMDFITTISGEELQQKDMHKLLQKIYTKAKEHYEEEAKAIVNRYLNNNFTNNYLIINILLISLDRVEKGLYDYIINKFSVRLADINKIQRRSERYIALMDSGILYINGFLTDEIRKIIEEISNFAWEV